MSIRRPVAAITIAAMLMPLGACVAPDNGPRNYESPAPRDYFKPDAPPPPSDYDASRDYRDDPSHDRALTRDDRVYRGSDGQYYCKRSNGTTGLVVGAGTGAVLGAILGGGGLLGILLGAGGGGLLGRSIDKGDVHCK